MATQVQDTQTQDATWEGDTNSQSVDEKAAKPWARCVSTNPQFPNVDLFENDTVFGRRATCTVQLLHPAISGQHCRIKREEKHVIFLKDLSTNGTFVNGKKVGKGRQTLLSNGAEIVLIRTAQEKISYLFFLNDQNKPEEGGPEVAYTLHETLGTGAFATVRIAIRKEDGAKFAVKVIDKKKFALNHGSTRNNALMDEVRILEKVDHPHVIKIHQVFDTPKNLFIMLELVTGGDLFDQIVAYGKGYPEDRARGLFAQMLQAIAYLHRHNIVHRDLKPENILLAEKDKDIIKISDFGLSRIVGEGSFMKTFCGTPQYLAPEVLVERKNDAPGGYDKAVDLWSLGVILYIPLSGSQPFNDNCDIPVLEQVKQGMYSFPSKLWGSVSKEGKDLVQRLLCIDPAKRITIAECFAHPWMAGYSDPGAQPAPAAAAAAAAAAPASGKKRKVDEQDNKARDLQVPGSRAAPASPALPRPAAAAAAAAATALGTPGQPARGPTNFQPHYQSAAKGGAAATAAAGAGAGAAGDFGEPDPDSQIDAGTSDPTTPGGAYANGPRTPPTAQHQSPPRAHPPLTYAVPAAAVASQVSELGSLPSGFPSQSQSNASGAAAAGAGAGAAAPAKAAAAAAGSAAQGTASAAATNGSAPPAKRAKHS